MTEARHCLWPSITSCTLLIRVNAINRCVINPFTLRSRWLNSKFKILQFAVIWRQTALLKSFIWMVAHKGFVHRCKACLKVGRVGQKMAHSSWEILTQEIGLAPKVWLHSSVGGILHRYRGGHGFESFEALIFFRLLSNCLNWKIYCDDHSSLSSTTAVHIWIISYILHPRLWLITQKIYNHRLLLSMSMQYCKTAFGAVYLPSSSLFLQSTQVILLLFKLFTKILHLMLMIILKLHLCFQRHWPIPLVQ